MSDQYEFGEEFNIYIQHIKEDINVLSNARETVIYLESKIKELNFEYETRSEQFYSIDPSTEAFEETKLVARGILAQEAADAILNTEEFDIEPFRENLLNACRQDESIEFEPSYNWLRVKFNLDLTAGTLDDYNNIVQEAKQELGVGEFRTSKKGKPMSMSKAWRDKMWYEKYYRPARRFDAVTHPSGKKVDQGKYKSAYNRTMSLIGTKLNGKAPFWRLINDGNTGSALKIRPQRFLDKAETQILQYYADIYDKEERRKRSYADPLAHLGDAISWAEGQLKEFQAEVSAYDYIWRTYVPQEVKDFTRTTIEQRLGERFSAVDEDKLKELDVQISQGNAPKRKRIGTNPETGRPITTRVSSIERKLRGQGYIK